MNGTTIPKRPLPDMIAQCYEAGAALRVNIEQIQAARCEDHSFDDDDPRPALDHIEVWLNKLQGGQV